MVPPHEGFAENALFEGRRSDNGSHGPNDHWMDYLIEVRAQAAQFNIRMDTADVLPIEAADIVVYMRQPASPKAIAELKTRHPGIRMVLVLCETALGGRYSFNPSNHGGFDAIITYDDRLVDHDRYFPLRPRAYYRDGIREGAPYEQRRTGCFVATYRQFVHRSGIFAITKGWHFSWSDWWDYVFSPGELIRYRSILGEAIAQYRQGEFDLYGEGWELLPVTRGRCLGIPNKSTLDYIGNYRYYFAIENHTGPHSLISERIWDALWGDAVPVYYGNHNIAQYIPTECFIDARRFEKPMDLLRWLDNVSRTEWTQCREAGREFIRGELVERFLPQASAADLLTPILKLANSRGLSGGGDRAGAPKQIHGADTYLVK